MDFRNFFKQITGQFKQKGFVGIISGGLSVAQEKWGGDDFLRANEVSLYTSKAISKRAEKVGGIEFVLKDARGNTIENDPLLNLLYKPNKVFTGREFWSLYQTYLDTVGEVYIYLEREPQFAREPKVVGMHFLMPTLVTPKFNEDGTPESFEYRTKSKTDKYKPEEILYIHRPNPRSPLRGQSILKAGINAIQTEIQISTYHSRVLENGGRVGGVFNFKTSSPLTENQLRDLKERYEKEYASAKKSGVPLFLGGDAQYINTALSPEELSFIETKKMTLEDICIMTSVPKSMLASTNDAKFDNADADRTIFLRETIHPLLVILTTHLDEVLFPDDRFLTFVDPTPENIEAKIKKIESGVKNYYMTVNEARELDGRDPIPGGDVIMVPFNLVPLGEGSAESSKSVIKNNKAIESPLNDADIRRMYWKVQEKRMNKGEKGFKNVLNKYFDGQSERILEVLQPANTRVFRKKGLADDSFNMELELSLGVDTFMPIITELLKEAGINAVEFLGSDYEFNLTSDIAGWIETRAVNFLTSINETTFKELQKQFEESLAAGEGREALIKRIENTYGNIKKSRAGLIARTEVHNATQYGTIQGYKQSGLTTKIWVSVLDASTRDSHAQTDGEERPIDIPFSNGLMFPGDPSGPPEEVINCRCVV